MFHLPIQFLSVAQSTVVIKRLISPTYWGTEETNSLGRQGEVLNVGNHLKIVRNFAYKLKRKVCERRAHRFKCRGVVANS